MHESRARQIELGFDGEQQAEGYHAWVQQRQDVIRDLGRRLGLPLGHEVEVWLRDGTLLKGRLLLLNENAADVELMIGRVAFKPAEIESCIRVD